MGLALTSQALGALSASSKSPNIALEIDGVPTIYGAALIGSPVKVGDGHRVGDPSVDPLAFVIGGSSGVADQETVISLTGTSTSIKQQLDPFKGQGTSVSTLSVSLVDDGSITELITPGIVVPDILQRKTVVRFGFQGTSYPADYIIVFRGFITDVTSDAGTVTFQLNGVNEKQRTNIYKKAEADLTLAMTAGSTDPIQLDDVSQFLTSIRGPSGAVDQSFKTYVAIDDEIIQYQSVSGSTLTGITRAQFGTIAAAHSLNTTANSFYTLTGNSIDLALKLMASGQNDGSDAQAAYVNEVVSSINVGGPDTVQNAIFFAGQNVGELFGLVAGDLVTLSGSAVSGNSVTKALVTDVIRGQTGDFIVLNQTLTTEQTTTAVATFFSQYNTLPDGCLMLPDEIDVAEHLRIKRLFLSDAAYSFYLKDTVDNARDFIEQEIYLPVSAYSLPRKARASLGYQIGPIPGVAIVTIDNTNVKSPKNLRVQRSTNTNFYNEIVIKYDESPTDDSFESGFIAISELSKARIKNSPNRTLTITSKGLKTSLGAATIVADKAQRRLNRYQYGAEQFTFQTMLDDGFTIEIGDIVSFDGTKLMLPDIRTGEKGIAPRLLEITNREFQLKTGDLKFTAVDTNFDGMARYGLISPSSKIVSVNSASEFTIGQSYAAQYGTAEYRKWVMGQGWVVRVRSGDFTQTSTSTIQSVGTNNLIRLKTPLTFTPTVGMVMEFTAYTPSTSKQKQIYAWFSADDFADGTNPYVML